MTSLALHTRTWVIWHEKERHTLRRPSWPGLAAVLDHCREPKVKHQDLRAMACECKGCLVDGCRGSASRSCGWPLGKKKRAIMRCHWCTADEEKTADREPGIAWRKQPQHATEQLTTTSVARCFDFLETRRSHSSSSRALTWRRHCPFEK